MLAILAVIPAAVLAATVALEVTPLQTVTVAGQVIKVGAGPRLGFAGPGEIDLFGQGLPTARSIPGPIQPKLQLSQITLNSELTSFVQGRNPGRAGLTLRTQLVSGWERYFAWESAAAGLAALILGGAAAGWRRLPARATVLVLVVGLVATEALNLGAVALTANGARKALQHVSSLTELVGTTDVTVHRARTRAAPLHGIHEVVLGDSTAAGDGLPWVPHATATDRACGRSAQSYAVDLAGANGWKELNLACNSATIAHGLLGPQQQGSQQITPQLNLASRVSDPSVVIVSVGADDLQWSAILESCAVIPQCDNRASNAFFQQKLAQFSTDYLQLLIQLGNLPGHPQVIINRYYDPFGSDVSCIMHRGLTAEKVATIRTWLSALNQVLAKGAAQFGYLSPEPNFSGHTICSALPFVQDLSSSAPFHPTALGQLEIALTDEAALASSPAPSPSPVPSSAVSTSGSPGPSVTPPPHR
ncbi:MAG TPA: GDSL-type esterase/lipase family protein [Streptosporangiaceae bacterium]